MSDFNITKRLEALNTEETRQDRAGRQDRTLYPSSNPRYRHKSQNLLKTRKKEKHEARGVGILT